MGLEIIFDPVAEAVENGLLMDERHQVLPDSDWVMAVNRWTGRDDLFVYYHHGTYKWVVAGWAVPPDQISHRICVELEVLDLAPDRGGWLDRGHMRMRTQHKGKIMEAAREQMKTRAALKKALKAEDYEEREDVKKWLRGRGHATIAAGLDQNWVGQASGGEALEEMKENVQRMVKVS